MQALITTAGGVALVERAAPLERAGDVVIDVAYAGVCRTDLAVVDREIAVAPGRVIGHEVSGRIAGTGELVAVVPFVVEDDQLRWLGIDRDGGFADRVRVPASSIVAVPRDLSPIHAAYVEPLAAALGALVAIEPRDRVVVEGHGRIAELVTRVVAAHGAHVERELAGPCDVIVETSGVQDVSPLLATLRRGGTLVLKGRAQRRAVLAAGEVVARDLIIRGASHGSFAEAVAWLHERRIAIDDLLAEPRSLDAYASVFAAAREESCKQMFRIEAR